MAADQRLDRIHDAVDQLREERGVPAGQPFTHPGYATRTPTPTPTPQTKPKN